MYQVLKETWKNLNLKKLIKNKVSQIKNLNNSLQKHKLKRNQKNNRNLNSKSKLENLEETKMLNLIYSHKSRPQEVLEEQQEVL